MPANENLELRISANAREILISDKRRGCDWRVDAANRFADKKVLPDGTVEKLPDGYRVTHQLSSGALVQRWTLAGDHVRVELEAAPDTIQSVSLPGAVVSADGPAAMLLSIFQGVLYQPTGEQWWEVAPPGGHELFSMAMNALLGARGGLLVTQENATDWECGYGETTHGPSFYFTELRCPVSGWYLREVRLYPVDANINAVAKRYRRRVQERGEFVSWAEKIAQRPAVEKLFGSLLAFTGYNHAPEVDYAAGAKKLQEMGFESVLYYPVRIAHSSLNFLMGGDKPIWLSDETIAKIHAVPGALVSPWGWYVDALDEGAEQVRRIYRQNPDGSTPKGWKIEEQQWYLVCQGEQLEISKQRFATDMAAMDWIHYDVVACMLGREACHAKNHASHPGRVLTRHDEVGVNVDMLGPKVNGNRIVSSEGFIDRYTRSYDIGSTKLWPACGRDVDFIPVPLTMLVFHDSTIHNWWETGTYNLLPGVHGRPGGRFGIVGSGGGHKMAVQDALYGCPPQVMPFGRQYGWVDVETRRTFSFCIQLADREVQKALQAALPVTKLHRRIGKLELLSFDFVTDDAAVQTTVFADGTRIVANVSDKRRDAGEFGSLQPNTWKEIKPA